MPKAIAKKALPRTLAAARAGTLPAMAQLSRAPYQGQQSAFTGLVPTRKKQGAGWYKTVGDPYIDIPAFRAWTLTRKGMRKGDKRLMVFGKMRDVDEAEAMLARDSAHTGRPIPGASGQEQQVIASLSVPDLTPGFSKGTHMPLLEGAGPFQACTTGIQQPSFPTLRAFLPVQQGPFGMLQHTDFLQGQGFGLQSLLPQQQPNFTPFQQAPLGMPQYDNSPLGQGLGSQDLHLQQQMVFTPFNQDTSGMSQHVDYLQDQGTDIGMAYPALLPQEPQLPLAAYHDPLSTFASVAYLPTNLQQLNTAEPATEGLQTGFSSESPESFVQDFWASDRSQGTSDTSLWSMTETTGDVVDGFEDDWQKPTPPEHAGLLSAEFSTMIDDFEVSSDWFEAA